MDTKVRIFLKNLTDLYPVQSKNPDKIKSTLQEYINTLTSEAYKYKDGVDFEKLFNLIKKNYRYKTIPSIPFIIDYMEKCKNIKEYRKADEYKVFVLILGKTDKETGEIKYKYPESYTVICGFGGKSQTDIIREKRKFYDIVKPRLMPKGTVIFKKDDSYVAYYDNPDGSDSCVAEKLCPVT